MRVFAGSIAFTLAALVSAGAPALAMNTVDLSQFVIAHAPPNVVGTAATSSSANIATPQSTTATPTQSTIEKQASSNVPAGSYTIVAPVLTGQAGTTSYIRFFNGETITETTNITVVGSPSGTVYGLANVSVPEYASPQYTIGQILQAAGAGPLTGGDTQYVLYLQDPSNSGNNGFQHVYWNANNGFFDNASVCTYEPNENYSGENQILINVYTTAVPAYPSQINLVNYGPAGTYTVTITDAATGQVLGALGLALQSNAVYSVPFSYFEQQINWTPSASQYNANMVFQPPSGQTYQLVPSQLIYNSQFGSYVNMSGFCAINHIN